MVLRETTAADLPDLRELWNDGRVMRWVGFPTGLGMTAGQAASWLDAIRRDPTRHHYVVVERQLGFCGEAYYRVRPERRAELDIKLRPEAQGRGIATAALSRLIETVFAREPDVDAVFTEPNDGNEAAERLYARCGLRPAPRPPGLWPADSYWERRRDA